ncbi:MAG: methyltransferase domain-containing protein [Candidatus Limnocylindrales bacterium]
MTDFWRDAVLARYFALSYRVLATPAGREFLRSARAAGAPVVHGYATAADLTDLLETLQPSAHDVILDLGCGVGEVAIAVHRRTGSHVVGIDASRGAIAEARRRATAEGVSAAVRFQVGELGSTKIEGSAAYALDSLMFLRPAPGVLASLVGSLEAPGRVFATFIDHRGLDGDAFIRWVAGPGMRIERLTDVTGEFAARSRERAAAARRVFRARPARAGRSGLLLVLAEEAAVSWLIKRGRLRRWRFTAIRATSAPPTMHKAGAVNERRSATVLPLALRGAPGLIRTLLDECRDLIE